METDHHRIGRFGAIGQPVTRVGTFPASFSLPVLSSSATPTKKALPPRRSAATTTVLGWVVLASSSCYQLPSLGVLVSGPASSLATIRLLSLRD
jgi:hypothetical protein